MHYDTHMTTNATIATTPHARTQCASRSLPVEAVAVIVADKLATFRDLDTKDVAVFVATLPAARGSLVGSNGDTVWAIVRGGIVVTVMLRRSDQPSTRSALRVDCVVR